MKVLVTGASGFIGSAITKDLLAGGHEVTGLVRSEESAKLVSGLGAQIWKGGLDDPDSLRQAASQADGIIHTAFIHDFSQYAKAADADKAAIEVMGEALLGTEKPMIVTGGILGIPRTNGFVTEADAAPGFPRASEVTTMALAEKGINASVVRLPPSVHDKGDKGFIPMIINIAKQKGSSAYIGDGSNRWPAVHRLDAARLFRLALEKATKGMRYNAIGDEGIALLDIAGVIGEELNLPVRSITAGEAEGHFDWMGRFIAFDNPALSDQTQAQLGWTPLHIGLVDDMRKHYF